MNELEYDSTRRTFRLRVLASGMSIEAYRRAIGLARRVMDAPQDFGASSPYPHSRDSTADGQSAGTARQG